MNKRVVIKGKSTVYLSDDGNFVKKDNIDNVIDIYDYLSSRDYNYFPKVVKKNRSNYYEYIDDLDYPIEQKGLDMIKLVGLLHNKTSFFKEVSFSKINDIYSNLENNIKYYMNYYNNIFDKILLNEYLSPSEYLYIRNYYKLYELLNNSLKDLDLWFNLMKDKNKIRVCMNHNNLTLEHFLKNSNSYLISWDKSSIDSPVIDLVNFYYNDYFKLEFQSILDYYLEHYKLSEEELLLFIVNISIPKVFSFNGNEIEDCIKLSRFFSYIYKTEYLVRSCKSYKQNK